MFLNNIHAVTQNTEPNSILLPDGLLYSQKILYDEFTTPASAPLTSPRTAEPGPGTWTITDTGNRLSVSAAGRLVATTTGTASTDPRLDTATFERYPGTGFYLKGKGAFNWGWLNTGDVGYPGFLRSGFLAHPSGFIGVWDRNTYAVTASYSTSTDYEFLMIALESGGYALIKGGAFTNWTLLWVGGAFEFTVSETRADVIKAFLANFASFEVDTVNIYNIYGEFGKTSGYASYHNYAPTLPVTSTQYANGLIEFWWSIVTSDVVNILFRRIDDDNTLIARFTQATNTVALIQRSAGVETTIASGSGTSGMNNGDVRRMLIRFDGTEVKIYTTTGNPVNTTTSFNLSETGFSVQSGPTLYYLNFWPLNPTSIPTTTGERGKKVFLYGDSTIAVGAMDSSMRPILELVENGRGYGCWQMPTPLSRPGQLVNGALASNVAADLAARSGTADWVLISAGINDVLASVSAFTGTDETNFKTAARTILDAMITKWSSVRISWALPATTLVAYAGRVDSVAEWITELAAESAYVGKLSVGADLRQLTANAANYQGDGVHYTALGYNNMAALWYPLLPS